MKPASLKKQIRLMETYSVTQGMLLAFLMAWFRFAPPVLQMEVPPDAEAIHLYYKLITYGALGALLVAFLVLVLVKSRLRREMLE